MGLFSVKEKEDNISIQERSKYNLVDKKKHIYEELEKLESNKNIVLKEIKSVLESESLLRNKFGLYQHNMIRQYIRSREAAARLNMTSLLEILGKAKPIDMLKLSKKRLKFFEKMNSGHLDKINTQDIRGVEKFHHKLEHEINHMMHDLHVRDVQKENAEVGKQLKNFIIYCKYWSDSLKALNDNTWHYERLNEELYDINLKMKNLKRKL